MRHDPESGLRRLRYVPLGRNMNLQLEFTRLDTVLSDQPDARRGLRMGDRGVDACVTPCSQCSRHLDLRRSR
jgi:hypothetical protein